MNDADAACLHHLFAAQARRTPDAVAVELESARLSYAELDRRADQLAHHNLLLHLQQKVAEPFGAAPGGVIGLCLERSLELAVGLLGILKVGAAYLPLDPSHPKERLALMLEDAQAQLVLASRRAQERLPRTRARAVCIDAETVVPLSPSLSPKGERENLRWPPLPLGGEGNNSLAYLIYTSGSTGRPKGVLVPHRALVNHATAVAKQYGLRPGDRVLQFASISFDVAAEEFFPTWLSGATVLLRPDSALESLTDFLDFVRKERLTVLNLPASYWGELVSELGRSRVELPPSVRLVIVGNELVPMESFRRWRRLVGGRVELFNAYGPTEATITATLFKADSASVDLDAKSLPIGRPIENVQVHVLDEHLQPVPAGATGELHIGGAGLSLGYLNQPELTAAKFIANPFSLQPGARLYKTGDLARVLPDGNLEFLRRMDDQVKIRGHRVEPGEVEAVLAQHPLVQRCAVVAREDAASGARLAAYVVGRQDNPDAKLSGGLLRSFLQERLPAWMVPAAFVRLAELPLTPSGKVDRRALPPPGARGVRPSSVAEMTSGQEMAQQFGALEQGEVSAPEDGRTSNGATEEVLAGIWSDVLGLEFVGVGDDFFALGGHSLLALQIVSRARAAFNVELGLSDLFSAPTVAGLAEVIDSGRGCVAAEPIVPRRAPAPGERLPLSFAQERLWFLDRYEPGSHAYNMAEALHITGPLDASALDRALTEIVRRHEIVRTTYLEVDGRPVQAIGSPCPFRMNQVDLRGAIESARDAEAQRLALAEARRPFDLGKDLMLRATLLRLGEIEHRLVLTMHHIASDAWSVAVLYEQLAVLYRTFAFPLTPALSPEGAGKGEKGKGSRGESPFPPCPLSPQRQAGEGLGEVELPLQYADFAFWQRGWVQGAVLENHLAYWREQLAGCPPSLDLPSDRARPEEQTFDGATISFPISPTLCEGLKALSRREGVTLYMLLLAGFQALLHRWTGQKDFAVGSPVAGRDRAETERLIGFFVNTLVLRADFGGEPTFGEVLARVRETVLGALAHQDLPFEKLVEHLQPQRDPARSPLFQVMFAFQNAPVAAPCVEGLAWRAEELRHGVALFDLTLEIEEAKEGLEGALTYNTDLFEPETMRRFAANYRALLEAMARRPEARVAEVELLRGVRPSSGAGMADGQGMERQFSALEHGKLSAPEDGRTPPHSIAEGGPLNLPDDAPCVLSDLLLRAPGLWDRGIAYLNRDGSAVAQGYTELLAEAQRVLGGLRRLGLQPQDKVVLQLQSSRQFFSAFWGCVLGGFVPVPVSAPASGDASEAALRRLRQVRELLSWSSSFRLSEPEPAAGGKLKLELQLPLIVSADRQAPAEPGWRVVKMEELLAHPPGTAIHPSQPDDLALLMLTSGSTAAAKLVMLTHRNLISRCLGSAQANGFSSSDVTLNWMPLDHVAGLIYFHLRDVFLKCRQIHAATAFVLEEPLRWLDWMERYRVTITFAPNFAYGLVNARAEEIARRKWDLSSVRYVLNGAEPIAARTARRFLQLLEPHGLPATAMRPAWGMAETSSGVTYSNRFSLATTRDDDRFVEVGAPIPGVALRVVDEQDRGLPEGTVGRLQVKGATVTPGYYAAPELNRTVFTADGWFDTGDRGFLREGQLTLTGRDKDVIILNGVNHHSHEIEAVVEETGAVKASFTAACAVRPKGSDGERLALFFCPAVKDEARLPALLGDLRALLVRVLSVNPAFLVPVRPEQIPKTPLGKIQRALLKEQFERGEFDEALRRTAVACAESREPRDETERRLAEIWQDLLRAPRVGARDNFFELGGHSLLATQLLARVRDAFGVEVPLPRLFRAPTIEALAEAVSTLKGGQRTRQEKFEEASPLRPLGRQGEFPLSFAQERLWFFDQLFPGSPAYNVAAAFRLSGRLDVPALERSLNELVRRHETLRTTFRLMQETPVQVIAREGAAPLQVIDLSGLAPSEREGRVRELATEEGRRPFDLSQGPLLRACLWRLSGTKHALLLSLHHINADGWSCGVLGRELFALYGALAEGRPAALPPLPIQYADFAQWQRERVQGRVLEEQLAYWRKKLAGPIAALELPTDRPRPTTPSFRGRTCSFTIPRALADELNALSRREGVTLFMALLAAFKALLHRYTGQEDVVVGTPIANRTRVEAEGLVGFLANTLALRTDLSGRPTFRELLGRARETALGAFAHQELPFEKLVEALNPERELGRQPLFQVMFVLQNAPGVLSAGVRPSSAAEALPCSTAPDSSAAAVLSAVSAPEDGRTPGLTLAPMPLDFEVSLFDLTLDLEETPEGLAGLVEYNTDLFDAATIDRLAGHYRNLLEGIVADADRPLWSLPLLSEAERRQVLVEWNDTRRDYALVKSLHRLVEEQAERTPENVAVVFGKESLSYHELNERADRLAEVLRAAGVGPEVLVDICAERSLEMVVGLLGILKAGGAYVPLDPELPAERLAFMLRDANAPVVLAQERWRELLGACSARVVWLDGDCPSPLTPTLSPRERGPLGQALVLSNQASLLNDLPAILPLPGGEGRGEGGGIVGTPDDGQSMRGFMDCTGSSSASIGPDRLAYMIYTSGSTGHPKGALNTHRGICNRLLWMQEQYELTARDAVLQKTPLSFDVSVWEVFWPLMAGARLVLAQPGGHRDPVYLAQLIASENVTVTHFVPSLLQLFLEQPGLERCQPLRLIISSGETLSPELAQRCLTALPVRLENLYGPTEAAVDVTSWTCRRGLAGRTVPIGRPVANTQIYIVDEHLQPAPCGVPGELLIGGVQVGRGYHNRPELTAERFVADPFSGEPGARMYRTGDLARWLPDGNIEFIGRRDLQVKLRGVRIELGEIDAALERHADISRAVTVLHEASGEKRLASFCVPRPGAAPTVEALRNFLRERLPEAMVPAALIFLDALPLTPSGKVDRRCLHAPAMQRPPSALASVPPYDLLEVQIQQVWEEVLGIQPVGVQDNFFDLGGHSLLAVRLFAQLEKATGHRLPLATLFQAPTVEQLGRVLRQEGWTPPWSSLVAIKPGGTRPPFYIIHGVGGNVLNFNRLAKHLGEDQPVYGLQSQGLDGRRAPVTRIEEMAAHYIKEIRSLQRTGPYHLGGMSFGGVVAFEMALQLRAHGEQVGLLALLDTFPLGYSELMPLTERSRQELALFTRRVRLHWENLASLSGRQKLDYAARKLRTIRRRIRSRLWGAAYKFFDRFGARAREHLPAVLQNVKEANFMAARDYVPKPYAGNVTLFLASDEVLADVIHPEQLWKKLALGGVEAHSIPGDHVNLIDEPHVQVLAERLRACLAVASGGHAWPN